MTNQKLIQQVTLVAVYSLAFIALSMAVVMLIGLFHQGIDNRQIFEVFTPAFQTIIGGFIGFLGGLQVRKNDE